MEMLAQASNNSPVGLVSGRAVVFAVHYCSTHFAFFRARRGRAPSRIEHRVDEFKDRTLIGGRQLFNALQAFQQPRRFRRERVGHRFQSEQRVGGDVQRAREIDDERAGRLSAFGFVIRSDALRHTGRVA